MIIFIINKAKTKLNISSSLVWYNNTTAAAPWFLNILFLLI